MSEGPTNDIPESIGPYRILDVLGEGGMAVVYLAEQSEPVRRRVALKILKAGMDSKQVVARFESERQALAVLDHPNIAKIFDGGMAENGRPWFAMEWVHGVPVIDYCDQHRLSNDARLRLFVDVCAAVQHAHLKGLIHRDLKPSNILVGVVDGKPQPKIIDFGIAKATTTTLSEATLYTKIGQIIGTPEYMSPEQAGVTGLDIDTRADVYSLGVILYELLVGTVPLDLHAIDDQAMQIALKEKDPPKPSTRFTELGATREEVAKVRATDPDHLSQELKGDLDWVVMKAIEKDRTRRYETANALAMECRRFLQHEPVLARPPNPGYLLKRFVQRNRVVVGAGAVVILAVVAGAVAATLGYVRATEAEQVALQEAETALQVSDFLVELFEVSDPSEARGNSITAREVLDRGADRIRSELGAQPDIQTTLMLTISEVYQSLGLLAEAEALITSAIDIRRREGDELQVAEALNQLSGVLILRGDFDGAELAAREAFDIREAAHGERHADVGHTLGNLATIDYYQAEYDQALAGFQQSFTILEQTLGANDPATINMLSNVSSAQWRVGNLTESERLQRMALERLRAIEGDDHPQVAILMNNLAITLAELGRPGDAEPYYLESLAIQKRLLGEHPDVANSMNNIGMYYMRGGQLDKALPMMEGALAMWSDTLGPSNQKTFIAHNNLGQLLIEMEDFEAAERHITIALDGRTQTFGVQHESVAMSTMFLCDVYNLTGRYGDCHATIPGAIAILEDTLPPGHRRTAAARLRLAMSMGGLDRFEDAEPIMLDAYAVFERTIPGSAGDRRARRWVARFYDLWGKHDEAARYR